MRFTVLTPPAVEPISLEEVKQHLRVDLQDDDALIMGYMRAARELVEVETQRKFITQTILFTTDAFTEPYPHDNWCGWLPPNLRARHRMEFPITPVRAVTNFAYTDENGVSQTLSPTAYALNAPSVDEAAWVDPAFETCWPATRNQAGAVRITATVGYGNPVDAPAMAKQAIKLLCGTWYEHREAVIVDGVHTAPTELPLTVQRLLGSLRWRSF